jgi:hypothetical protein
LWKHVFVVELIKLHFGNNQSQTNNLFSWLKDKFSGDRPKKMAIEYLEKWENKFWETTEYQIREFENQLEKKFQSNVSNEISFYENSNKLAKLIWA